MKKLVLFFAGILYLVSAIIIQNCYSAEVYFFETKCLPTVLSAEALAKVEVLTKAGGSSGSGDGQFSYPQGVAVDQSGNVYVADSSNFFL